MADNSTGNGAGSTGDGGGGGFNPAACARFGGCTGYVPQVFHDAPGGSLGFLAGLGDSFVNLADLSMCMASTILCAQDTATGNTFSGAYTRWAARHGVDTNSHSTYTGGRWAGVVLQMGAGGLLGSSEAAAAGATEAGGARFVAGSDGVTDTVRTAPNAVTLGRYPGYVRAAALDGSRTFNLGNAWEDMAARTDRFGATGPGSEVSIRNMSFLDKTIANGSDIRLSSDPLDPANAGSAFLDEIDYLQKAGYSLQGNRMVP